jgi:hypothetical protein
MDQLQEVRFLGTPMTPPYILEQIVSLPNLQILEFTFNLQIMGNELFWLQALAKPNLRFTNSLRELNLNSCHVSNTGFRYLLSQVVPNFPNLKVLSLCYNNRSSFEGIASLIDETLAQYRIENHEDRLQFPFLEQLILSENPVWILSESTLKISNGERDILARLLQNCAPSVGCLGYRFETRSSLQSPQVQHWLDVNKLGRCLIDRGYLPGPSRQYRTGRVAGATALERDDIDRIPIAIWAMVLSRANAHFIENEINPRPKVNASNRHGPFAMLLSRTNEHLRKVDASNRQTLIERQSNTIYYLLRHGPALVGRTFS